MEQPQREMARHSKGNEPEELNVDAKTSFNDQFMTDMHSSCRPEKDGYFGSTSGDPSRLTFGFRLETKPLSSIVDILDLVEDRIVDSVLSESFPELCGFRRKLSEGRASGFRFLTLHESGMSKMERPVKTDTHFLYFRFLTCFLIQKNAILALVASTFVEFSLVKLMYMDTIDPGPLALSWK